MWGPTKAVGSRLCLEENRWEGFSRWGDPLQMLQGFAPGASRGVWEALTEGPGPPCAER